jgi:hypothetical protein
MIRLINNNESAIQDLPENITWRSSHDTEVGGGRYEYR